MALNNYGPADFTCSVNGRTIDDWGETDPPYTDEPIDPASVLRRGLGGNAVRLDRINPGRRVTLHLQPGSPDSAFMQGLFGSNANITFGMHVIGSLETAVGTDGLIVNDATMGRAGVTISDDTYILEFNIWTAAKGGDI